MQLQQTRRRLPCGPLTTVSQLLPPSKGRERKNPRGKQACSSWPTVSFLSNPLSLKSSFQFKGPEIEGPDRVAERGAAIRSAPSSFRACTPKMKTPFLFFFLSLSSKETKVPAPQRTSNGASRPSPTRRPNTCRAPSRLTAARSAPEALARLIRSRGTEGTLATRPAASAASVLPTAWAAPGGPGRTGGCHLPESPDRAGPRRQGGESVSTEPHGTTPRTAGRRLCARSQSVFSNRLVLTRPRLLPPPGSRASPRPYSPRSRDLGLQPRAAGGRVHVSTPRPLEEGLHRKRGA